MSPSLTNPTGSEPILAAVTWFEATFLGTVATIISILAVAVIGFLMLNGRMPAQRAATVILGCFIIAGAQSIANGITGFAQRGAGGDVRVPPSPPVPPAPSAETVARPPQPLQTDPYAGASVPTP